jgi:hypothetical protein
MMIMNSEYVMDSGGKHGVSEGTISGFTWKD